MVQPWVIVIIINTGIDINSTGISDVDPDTQRSGILPWTVP
jgi:hypothetical protein